MPEDGSEHGRLSLDVEEVGNVVIYTLRGVMTLENFIEVATPLMEEDRYASTLRLWDFREAGAALTSADIFIMGKVIGDAFKDVPSVGAYIANPGVHFMKLETYRRARSDELHTRKVFTTKEEALEWLESQEFPVPRPARRPTPERSEP